MGLSENGRSSNLIVNHNFPYWNCCFGKIPFFQTNLNGGKHDAQSSSQSAWDWGWINGLENVQCHAQRFVFKAVASKSWVYPGWRRIHSNTCTFLWPACMMNHRWVAETRGLEWTRLGFPGNDLILLDDGSSCSAKCAKIVDRDCELFGYLSFLNPCMYLLKTHSRPSVVYMCFFGHRFSNRGYMLFRFFVLFQDVFFLGVSFWGSFPCYLLHFRAKISDLHAICCILELKSLICSWLLAFGFDFWLLALAFGVCFWLLAFGWVFVL